MDVLAEFIERKRIDGALAETLQGLDQQSHAQLEQLCSVLDPSANTLRGLLDTASQIAAREKTTLFDVLDAPQLQEVLALEQVPRKEKQRRYREILAAARYPQRVALEAEIERLRKNVVKATGLAITCPPDMEGDAIHVSFRVRSAEDMERWADSVQTAAHGDDVRKLFALLHGEEDI